MIRWLTGGRPMRRLAYAFTDKVTGRPVYYFMDGYDRLWMAEHRWSLFRVPGWSEIYE